MRFTIERGITVGGRKQYLCQPAAFLWHTMASSYFPAANKRSAFLHCWWAWKEQRNVITRPLSHHCMLFKKSYLKGLCFFCPPVFNDFSRSHDRNVHTFRYLPDDLVQNHFHVSSGLSNHLIYNNVSRFFLNLKRNLCDHWPQANIFFNLLHWDTVFRNSSLTQQTSVRMSLKLSLTCQQ